MIRTALCLFAATSVLTGCTKPESKTVAVAASASEPKFNTDLPMDEFMGHVVDPAAFAYWHGSGTEVTDAGERDLSPTTEEGWEALETGAAVLIEAGNAMQLPGRVQAPAADWNKWAQLLSSRAVEAKAAALKHDRQAVFDEGGRVYEVCTSCHKEYVIDPALAAEGGPPPGRLPDWPVASAKPHKG